MNIKIDHAKHPHIIVRFEADATHLRHYQQIFKDLPNGDEMIKNIETHLKECKARQNFVLITTDEKLHFDELDDGDGDFITIEDMEI